MPTEERHGHRGGPWHGGGGRGRGWGPLRERPPWWPAGEPWPPQRPEAWRSLRRRFARRAAGFAAVVLLALVVVGGAIIWLLTALFGAGWTSFALGLVLVVLLALFLRGIVRAVRTAVAPMGDLIEAAARVEDGQFGTEVPVRGPGELRALARAFNAMSRRLAETDAERRRLLADVSHELRTPLTVIQGNVEGMLDGLYAPDRDNLERILAETRRLERLVEDLRTLSMADAGALSLQREPTDLGALAADVVAGFRAAADGAGVTLLTDAADGLPDLELDPLRVRQVVGNLVANALAHTPAGGRVTVTVRRGGGGDAQLLSVADTGVGMDPDAASHAFDRFWRGADSGGAGLGLAIARDLVRAHGGEVELTSQPDAGTTVTCRFPA